MSHKFVRNITGVRNIKKQELVTNVQNDILSTNKLDSTRKYPVYIRTGYQYHCLTDNIKSINHFLYPKEDNDLDFHLDWKNTDPNDPQTIINKPFETIGPGLAVDENGVLYNTLAGVPLANGIVTQAQAITIDGLTFILDKLDSNNNWGIKLENNTKNPMTYTWYFKHYYGSDGASQSGGMSKSNFKADNLPVNTTEKPINSGFLEADNLMLGYGSAGHNRVVHEIMVKIEDVWHKYAIETILLNMNDVDLKAPYISSLVQRIY